MNSVLINENKTIWLGLVGSFLIHALIFICSGTSFIPQAQYSVQPSVQTVEVSIEETKQEDQSISNLPTKQTFKNNKVTHFKSGVRAKANPDYFQNPPPEYPELARQMHQEGIVMLSVDVNKEGDPVSVVIIQSSGFRMLDQAALKAVRHWKFQPGSIGGIFIDSTVTVPIRFRLEK